MRWTQRESSSICQNSASIDEAQRVPDIGLSLKILVDSLPDVAVLATGSASFDLANKISEPLTGRKLTFMRYPLGFAELAETPVL